MRGCLERAWHRACTSPALSTRELLGRLSSLCTPHRGLSPRHPACSCWVGVGGEADWGLPVPWPFKYGIGEVWVKNIIIK